MLRSRKIPHSRCEVWFFFSILALSLALMECYDPCPENLRRTSAARPSTISRDEIERAFQKAKDTAEKLKEREDNHVKSGRIVNKRVKSPASTHQQAFVNPEIRQREVQQRIFHECSKILARDHSLTSEEVCCSLPKADLTGPTASQAVQNCSNRQIQCDSSFPYRTADGTCNNLNNPTWGCAFSCFNRHLKPWYSENETMRTSEAGGPLPEPRTLSLNCHSNYNNPTNHVNHLYMVFGQLLDHDVTLTATSTTGQNEAIRCCPPRSDNHPQCAPIIIAPNDPFYSKYNITCMEFIRSGICPLCTLGPRVQMNLVTACIDASFAYGNSDNETNNLRDSSRRGNMRVQTTGNGVFLPFVDDPNNDPCSIPDRNQICYDTGDIRANQHPPLTSLHTIFVRQHNRMAEELRRINRNWNEETIFQEARKILGAMMQMMTYNEFLPPTISNERMSYFSLWVSNSRRTSYDRNVDPTLYTEFSTFAFRLHTLVNNQIPENPGLRGHYGHWLRDKFFYPFDLEVEIDHLMRGSTTARSQRFDRHLTEDVTNFLYRIQGNDTGFDLAAFNIQRGRDHGMAPYVDMVEFCSQGEIKVRSFYDLTYYKLMPQENVDALRANYWRVRDVDAFTGMTLEWYKSGAVVGPTAICFIGIQFHKLKFGDRFYFEHVGEAGSFTNEQVNEIKKATLAGLVCENTGVTEMPRNAMLLPSDNNRIVPCSQIPRMNLEAWRQK